MSDRVGKETTAWIRETIETSLKKGGVRRISEQIKELRKFGGKIYACPVAIAFYNATKDELIEEVNKVRGIHHF